MDSDRIVYLCALSKVFAYRCAVGRSLLEHFGGAKEIFEAGRKRLAGVLSHAGGFLDSLLDPSLLDWAQDEVEWAFSSGIRLLGQDDPAYPRRLAACDDAPLMLYCKGPADLNAPRSLAVVGTRKATWYGREVCRRLVSSLSELDPEPMVVSGLALGIDGTAHLSALEAGLSTVAVLPCGLDEIYPRQHGTLASRIAESGALVSDFPRKTSPVAFTFLRRNRIIAGMADATLLAESFAKGGGLITTSLADSYGRTVFAVPGRLTDVSFEGCNKLIATDQARLVADTRTIPSAMEWEGMLLRPRRREVTLPGDSPLKREIVLALERHSPCGIDFLSSLLEAGVSDIGAVLFELELEGRVKSDGSVFFLSL